jgi:signal transduction histidine kinase
MINLVPSSMRFFNIKVKFTIIAILISLISFGAAAFFSTQWLAEEIQHDYKEKAVLMGTHIIHDVGSAMVSKIHGGITDVLNIYRDYKDVEEVRVFNRNGDEIFSKRMNPPETRVKEALTKGEPISFHKEINKKEVASYIIPIKNSPECHSCHGKSEPLRGVLLLSLNQEQMKKYVGQQKQRFFLLFGLIAMAISAATVVAISRFFLKPLSLIQKGAEAIGKGEFQYQIPVKSKDEIGTLADNFNRMAQTLHDKNEMLWEQVRLLSRSQKEWQETFDSITDLVAVIDKEFNITRANRAFYKYILISPYTEIDKKCYELLGTCVRPNCPHVLSMGGKKYINNEIWDEKAGKVLDVSYFPYYSPEGDFFGTIFIAKDITGRKENEMRLILNERLAALGQMASGIAHEINNPLATISVCAEGLTRRIERGELDPSLFESYLRIITEEVSRCKAITTSMLSFVRKPRYEKKEIHAHEALDKTLELIGLQDRLKDVEILKNYHSEIPAIRWNEGELIQVFLSILINALDAMENSGKLTLETTINQNGIFIKISDTGPGIPPHLINRIFEPFFTTREEKGGTGLGLSIAKKIIEENKGKIEVNSMEKKGTTFTIILPIESPP